MQVTSLHIVIHTLVAMTTFAACHLPFGEILTNSYTKDAASGAGLGSDTLTCGLYGSWIKPVTFLKLERTALPQGYNHPCATSLYRQKGRQTKRLEMNKREIMIFAFT